MGTVATATEATATEEHHEEPDFLGPFHFAVGTGDVSNPTILAMMKPAPRIDLDQVMAVLWEVTNSFGSPAAVNDLKVKIVNDDSEGKKLRVDRVMVEVQYQ